MLVFDIILNLPISLAKEFFSLLHLEWFRFRRQPSSILSVCLYIASLTYLVYILLQTSGGLARLEVLHWNILYWLIVLFAIITLVHQNFSSHSPDGYFYFYTSVSSVSFILSKIIYLGLSSIVVALFAFFLFGLWLGNPIHNITLFVYTIILASGGFSIIYSLTSAIALSSANSWLLSSLLGFPLSIPIILFTARLSRESFGAEPSERVFNTVGSLMGFDLMMIVLAVILYPYIWKK